MSYEWLVFLLPFKGTFPVQLIDFYDFFPDVISVENKFNIIIFSVHLTMCTGCWHVLLFSTMAENIFEVSNLFLYRELVLIQNTKLVFSRKKRNFAHEKWKYYLQGHFMQYPWTSIPVILYRLQKCKISFLISKKDFLPFCI